VLNWGRFVYGGGEYSDAPDLKEALRRVRVERGQEAEYRPPVTKPKVRQPFMSLSESADLTRVLFDCSQTDKWQRK
jgi:hypothetical protein